jgi:hypothetical protein
MSKVESLATPPLQTLCWPPELLQKLLRLQYQTKVRLNLYLHVTIHAKPQQARCSIPDPGKCIAPVIIEAPQKATSGGHIADQARHEKLTVRHAAAARSVWRVHSPSGMLTGAHFALGTTTSTYSQTDKTKARPPQM